MRPNLPPAQPPSPAYPAHLYQLGDHDDACTLFLPHHAPEIVDHLRLRPWGRRECLSLSKVPHGQHTMMPSDTTSYWEAPRTRPQRGLLTHANIPHQAQLHACKALERAIAGQSQVRELPGADLQERWRERQKQKRDETRGDPGGQSDQEAYSITVRMGLTSPCTCITTEIQAHRDTHGQVAGMD